MRPDHDSVANIIASFDRDRARIAALAEELLGLKAQIADLDAEIEHAEARPKMQRILGELRAELDEKETRAAALEAELTLARGRYREELATALRPERAACVQAVEDALAALLANWKLIDMVDTELNAAGDVVRPHVSAENIAIHLRAAVAHLHPMSVREVA